MAVFIFLFPNPAPKGRNWKLRFDCSRYERRKFCVTFDDNQEEVELVVTPARAGLTDTSFLDDARGGLKSRAARVSTSFEWRKLFSFLPSPSVVNVQKEEGCTREGGQGDENDAMGIPRAATFSFLFSTISYVCVRLTDVTFLVFKKFENDMYREREREEERT